MTFEQARCARARLCAGHLEVDSLYLEVKERIGEMNNQPGRRQLIAPLYNTVVRPTVVTIFGRSAR
jgi:hypothetical protein